MKRNFWKKNEVKCMLDVFRDLNVVQLLEQKTLPINDIYKRVEHAMGKRGFKMKNGKQIQSKWSQMKSAYMCVKRNHKADFYKMKDPEFRDDVAELVEAEMDARVSAPLTPALTDHNSIPVEEESGATPLPSQAGSDIDDDEIQDIGVDLEEAEEAPPIAPQRSRSPPTKEREANSFRQGSYRKSFWKFMQQLKALELDLQQEFITKQTRLMTQEHKLQMQRDNLIIASFAANTNQILKSTQELIEKGFSR